MTDTSAAPPALEFLDANPVLRYLLADHPDQFVRSRELIESERRFRISTITLTEIAYVLIRVAGVPRADAVDALVALLERENIAVHEIDTDFAIQALILCRPSGRVNFGDAMLWAVARDCAARVWTFDDRFPAVGIEVGHP